MLRSPETVKSSLLGIVSDMSKDISSFVRNPATDFTRDRKLNFKNTVSLILSMGGQSLNSELIDYFQYVEPQIPTASALIQQSDKLLPDALSYIFHHFNDPSFPEVRTRETFPSTFATEALTLEPAWALMDCAAS